MIFRPLTLICALAAGGFGWNLYQVKHHTALLDRELASIAEQIKTAQKQKETLESIWGELNLLPRLRNLSQQLLPIETNQTPQNRSFAELDRRLPPAQPFDGALSAFAPREGTSAPETAIALLPPAPTARAVMLAATGQATTAMPGAASAATMGAMPGATSNAPGGATSNAPGGATSGATGGAPVATTGISPAPVAVVAADDEVLPLPPPAPPPMLALAEPRAILAAAPRPARQPLPPIAAPAAHVGAAPAGTMAPMAAAYTRPSQPPRPMAPPVAPEPPARSMLGAVGGPLLAPPVPFASASASTLGSYGR